MTIDRGSFFIQEIPVSMKPEILSLVYLIYLHTYMLFPLVERQHLEGSDGFIFVFVFPVLDKVPGISEYAC